MKELPEALHVGLSDKDKRMLDVILQEDPEVLNRLVDVLPKSAAKVGLESNIKLMLHQVTPALMMEVSKRVFNGFSPGIGKTYSSCASYAFYRLKAMNRGETPKKLLLVTENIHIKGMESDFLKGGVKLYPLFGGNDIIKRQLKKVDNEEEGLKLEDNYDGIVTTWDTLKTNEFLEYYMKNVDYYKFGIFDETACLMNTTPIIYKVTDSIVNIYGGGMDRVMFLNGTSYSKNIYDIYNQMKILRPKLIPNKRWIDDKYVVKESRDIWSTEIYNNKGSAGRRRSVRKVADIVDYKNQEDFRQRLRYYYIFKNKSDVKDVIPENNYKLHVIPLSAKLKKVIQEQGGLSIHTINSPGTADKTQKLSKATHPKLDYLLKRFKETEEDRPVIYCLNKASMYEIQGFLEKEGYSVGILNGDVKTEDKSKVQELFNTGKLDTLILNAEKAINLPNSDRMIFYNIPSSPLSTNQIKARIDRNNYTTPKFYDFLCYRDSPEVGYITRLGFFRETHSKLLTGQGEDNVYESLVEQLKDFMDKEVLDEVGKKFDYMHENNLKWTDIEKDISELLGVPLDTKGYNKVEIEEQT